MNNNSATNGALSNTTTTTSGGAQHQHAQNGTTATLLTTGSPMSTTTAATATGGTTTGTATLDAKYNWEEVYRSESAMKPITKRYTFRSAKITERKLNGAEDDRIISFNLHRASDARQSPAVFAYFITSIGFLKECPLCTLSLIHISEPTRPY